MPGLSQRTILSVALLIQHEGELPLEKEKSCVSEILGVSQNTPWQWDAILKD
ncbi:3-isopropylmalate dehydrogenase [Clarias magur]|uniref:3-isopropylmalate dehydrogenase n=1 Tax=Clarias magur TaxID=1594786 RepID=A0A8J4X434_CLAMG|nr:3-isopropylmalate dehydrogenase [Clarias magur]